MFYRFPNLPYEIRHYIYVLATPPRIVRVDEGPINVEERTCWREEGYISYFAYAFEQFYNQMLESPPRFNAKLHPDLASFAHNWRSRIPGLLRQTRQEHLEKYGFTSSRPPYQPWKPSAQTPSIPTEWLMTYPELAFEMIRESCLWSTAEIPAFLHVSAESRQALVKYGYRLMFATRTAGPRTWFHPRQDRLYIPHTRHFYPPIQVDPTHMLMSSLDPSIQPGQLLSGCNWDIGQYSVRDLRKVKYLMLGSGGAMEDENQALLDVQSILPLFSCLESIYLESWTKEDIIGWYQRSGTPFNLEISARTNSVCCIPVEDIDIVGSVYWGTTTDERKWPGRIDFAGWANNQFNAHKYSHDTHYPEARASKLQTRLLAGRFMAGSSTGHTLQIPTIRFVHSCPEALSKSFVTSRHRFWSIFQSLDSPSPGYSSNPSIFAELASLPAPFQMRWEYKLRYKMEWPEFTLLFQTPTLPSDEYVWYEDWGDTELQAWYLKRYSICEPQFTIYS